MSYSLMRCIISPTSSPCDTKDDARFYDLDHSTPVSMDRSVIHHYCDKNKCASPVQSVKYLHDEVK